MPVVREYGFGYEIADFEVAEKSHFGTRTEPFSQEVRDLHDDELWHDERTFVRPEKCNTGFMVAVGLVIERIERAGIDDEDYCPNPSSSRISSIRRAVSV